MPVMGSKTPTVNVSVPVPTPVQSAPKRPAVQFAPDATPQQPVGPSGVPPVAPPRPQMSAVILPWSPPPKGKTQMRRLPGRVVRYSTNGHASFHEAINNGDKTARKVYADYVEENGGAEPWVIHLLRHHEGQLHVRTGDDGRPTLNFVKTVDPGVVERRGLPTTIRYTDGKLSMMGKSGQTIMQFREYDHRGHLSIRDVVPRKGWTPRMVRQLHDVWDQWHLNDMKSGTPAQEEHLRANPIHVTYPASHFEAATTALTAAGLNPDPTTGHRYGHAWLREEVPSEVLHFLATLPGPHVPKPRTPKTPPAQMRRLPRRVVRFSKPRG